jgi:hypothetical protein
VVFVVETTKMASKINKMRAADPSPEKAGFAGSSAPHYAAE